MNASLQRVIERIVQATRRGAADSRPTNVAEQPSSDGHERWPAPADEPKPPRQTEIPPDAQHDGRPPHMNPTRPG